MSANSDDVFEGGEGNDFLAADGGNDTLYGYGVSDRLLGGSGDDKLYGDDAYDYLYGGSGNDVLIDTNFILAEMQSFDKNNFTLSDFQQPYNEYFHQGIDNVYQYIATGNVLDGGEGDDFLSVNPGGSTLIGGGNIDYYINDMGMFNIVDDADTYEIKFSGYANDSNDAGVPLPVVTIIDVDDFSSTDTIRMTMWERDKMQFTRRGNDLVLTGYYRHGSATIGAAIVGGEVVVQRYFDINARAENKTFVFASGETLDLAYMKSGLMRFKGAGSRLADHIIGTSANDNFLFGYDGNDLIEGGAGNDRLDGGLGIDILYGGDGIDILDGREGNDGLNGNAGNDTLYGGAGNDNLYGGLGSDADTYLFLTSVIQEGQDVVTDIDDATAVDTLYFASYSTTAIFSRVGNDLVITGYGDASNKVTVKQFYDASTYANNKMFRFADKTIKLQTGNFIFRDTAASNTLYGTSFGDDIWGMAGNDTLYGYAGNDTLLGGDGADVLQGGVGNDLLYGGNGNDGLNGNEGNDTLFGQAGNDTLYGGSGDDSDTYVFYKGYGQDTVIDTDDMYAMDTLKFVDINSGAAKFSKVGNDLYISGYGTVSDKVIVKQFYDTSVYASNKKFQFQDKTLTAAQAKALVQQTSSLSSAMSSLSNSSTAAIVSSSAGNTPSISLAASA